MTNKLFRLILTVTITVALLQACVSCAVSKNKQTRAVVTDSARTTETVAEISKKDSVTSTKKEQVDAKGQQVKETVTETTPVAITDPKTNITNVYPKTVTKQTVRTTIEYKRSSSDSVTLVRMENELKSIKEQLKLQSEKKESVKMKESKPNYAPWLMIILLGGGAIVGWYKAIKKPV